LKLAPYDAKRARAFSVGKHELTAVPVGAGFRGKPVHSRNHTRCGSLAAFPLPTHGTRFLLRDELRPKPAMVSG
jgi:hypothetical protein